jgi:nucleoside-diphosphate kinase
MAIETTLVLVKPDGVRRALCGEVVARFERRGYELRGVRLLNVSKSLAREHYAEHRGKPFFGELVDFITSGPVLAVAVRGENAIAGVRTMMGATNPSDALPGTIRGDLATQLAQNVVHGSDSKASARRELSLYFPDGLV